MSTTCGLAGHLSPSMLRASGRALPLGRPGLVPDSLVMVRLFALRLSVALTIATATTAALAVQPIPAFAAQPGPVERCRVADNRLAELSGLAADGENWYAVPDGGRQLQIAVLGRDCGVLRMITAPVDPFDVEDLARGGDGRLWLADIGDNARNRETIALHVLPPRGSPALYRLTYPDGPHDAEALILDRQDRPHVITKEVLGGAGVYRPAGPLSGAGPTPLERVATLRVPPSTTPGGPTGTLGATLITGAATSTGGGVLAVRTYTDAYLYPVPGDDLVAALAAKPVRVPLAGEPQGEAIAFEPDGTLLSASERASAGVQPIRAVPGAADLVAAPRPPDQPTVSATPEPDSAATPVAERPEGGRSLSDWQAMLLAIVAAAAVVVVIGRVSRRG
jgi:hypothetical protein